MKFNGTSLVRAIAALKRTMTSMRVPPLPGFLLAVLMLGIVYELFTIYAISGYNQSIDHPSRLQVTDNDPPRLIFARAHYLDSQGRYQDALRLYNRLEYHDDPAFRERVKFNMGTIYLREGEKLWNAQGVQAYAQINTLLELSEAAYREVLRLNDENWDARFNLEYALTIRPPKKTAKKADWKGRKSSVYAVFPGAPGGGP